MLTPIVLAKVTVVFALVLLFAIAARRASAPFKHALLVAGQLAALSIPLLGTVMPPLAVNVRTMPKPVLHAPGPVIEDAAPATVAAVPRRNARDAAVTFWLAGLLIVAATKLTAFLRAALIVRRAERERELLFTGELEQPSTFFHWILLPNRARTWSAERLRPVLLHEQAHVARRDTLLGIIGDVACAVYWFHPFAWMIARRARLERERACDDLVLSRGVDAGDYASAMIAVARSINGRTTAALAMAERSQLEQRIRAILDPRVPHKTSRVAALATVIVTLSAAPLLAAITPFKTVPRPASTEPDLLGDDVALPWSERIGRAWKPAPVEAKGRDANLIALLQEAASKPPRASDDFVPERARWALTQMRGGELVPPLVDALRDEDWRVRAYAAWALGHSNDARATMPILPLLDEPVWRVRAMAAHALANLGDARAEAQMLQHIDDPAWQVRMEVVRYLQTIGGHDATVAQMTHDRHIAVRGMASR
jgi:beta-lactamase regulating signal transducer with metallopeptidase domain